MSQHKVKLDASTNQKARQTTFFLKSEHKKELEKAKKALLAMLSPVVSILRYLSAGYILTCFTGNSRPSGTGFYDTLYHWTEGRVAQDYP